ncbi:hypothetical protein TraAM80_02521 [Trypanosoma rangeli]|uniref:Uncharacterized protein n=1 Tax=Trypanosoma rangeli TaxID=5698 RepID=A0A422NUG7_TRYRA|nr:uncharacterized protein TraAM80_02521 [Trypanosoma rangeli]RNF09089.1 hypothetical protein TraAM80_02521 [Trypanosoma rangeli]|eukprot:RNF09089.1 hypothetical protein TraAM80_02521 [Trypanosoma rangeli]
MSQMLARLLPALLRHLSGDTVFTAHNHSGDEDVSSAHAVAEEVRKAEKKQQSSQNGVEPEKLPQQQDHAFHLRQAWCGGELHGQCGSSGMVGSRSGSADVAATAAGVGWHRCSAQRWRRCVELWRHLLGSDRLFLALLFHSGALWAVEWCPSVSSPAPDAAATGTEAPRSWSKSVVWFLQLHEETATPVKVDGSTSLAASAVATTSGSSTTEGCKGETGSAPHMYAEDEVVVQRTAMTLLSEWFAIVDRCGKRFARAYYFSCALKIAALVGNLALVEDIPHLHDIVLQEPRSVAQFTTFCSILCCLLVEEAQQQQPFRLQLPPPFFLLNFNLIGRGSRIGVWLPRKLTGDMTGVSRHGAAAASGGSGGGACAQEAQFHSCEVCSFGVMLRVPPASAASASVPATGDLILGVRLLDEAYVQVMDVLPIMCYDADDVEVAEKKEEEHDNNKPSLNNSEDGRGQQLCIPPERKRRGRGRRPKAITTTADVAPSPCRCWSAFSPLTQGYVRVDLLHPRAVSAIVPPMPASSPSASTGGPGRRRSQRLHHPQPQSHEEAPTGTVPLRRSSCITAQRDPLATIVFALATTARRLIGCRGLFLEPPCKPSLPTAAAVHNADTGAEDGVGGKGKHARGPRDVGGETTQRRAWGTADETHSTAADRVSTGALAALHTVEEELECLTECAIHLFLEAMLLCRALSSEVVPQIDAWAMEVASNAVDLALATPQPVSRHLHAVGYVLCLVPHPHQSLLVTVGLFATLAQRQREGNKSSINAGHAIGGHVGGGEKERMRHGNVASTGWWDVFKVCVLKDAVIPGQLCSGTWELVERVERSLRVTPHVRLHSRQQQQQQQQQQQDDGNTIQTANEEGKLRDRVPAASEEATPCRSRLALQCPRTSVENDGPVKKMKSELQPVPVWVRATRVVEVGTQKRDLSLRDWVMAMWWSLERAAADAV